MRTGSLGLRLWGGGRRNRSPPKGLVTSYYRTFMFKSGAVNDRKVRDRVVGVDWIQVLSTEFKIYLLLHEEEGTFTILEAIILSSDDILVLGSRRTQLLNPYQFGYLKARKPDRQCRNF